MDTFGHYWHRAMAGINRTLGREHDPGAQLAELEQQVLALASDMQTLDGKLEGVSAEEARHRSAFLRRLDGLDQSGRENDSARATDATRLSECEDRIAGLETASSQDRKTVVALEASVTETAHRLETRNQQIKFLQDSALEQLKVFRTELAEASSRLETRDNETNRRLDEEHELLVSLECSRAEALGQIEAADREITALKRDVAELRSQIDSFLDSTTAQLEAADKRATLLEKRAQTDGELKGRQLQQLQLQLQSQETRLTRAVFAGAVILSLLLLLVTVAILR